MHPFATLCVLSWRGLRRAAAAALAACWVFAPPAAAANYDWCAPIVVRPDQRIVDTSSCTSIWNDADIASGANVVLLGDFTDVSHPVIKAPGRTCDSNPSHASNAAYVQRLKSARTAAGKPPLEIVHMHRFELVPATYAALSGFNAAHLLGTDRPWQQVLNFFDNDSSPDCVSAGCRWSDSWQGQTQLDAGQRIRDYIDRSLGTNAFQRIVYYLPRPPSNHVYYPTAAIANLQSAAYRAWRVAEAKEAIRVGGYTAIELNHKLPQYRMGHWIGLAGANDVTTLDAAGDTYWTAPPRGYAYAEYVDGWSKLAADLKANGVPYEVTIALRAWIGQSYDDPATPADEALAVRNVMKGARLVLLDRPTAGTDPQLVSQAVAEIQAFGPKVVVFDQTCGFGAGTRAPLGPPGTPNLLP